MTVTTTPATSTTTDEDAAAGRAAAATDTPDAAPLVAGDLLVEDVSIDGMCGVY